MAARLVAGWNCGEAGFLTAMRGLDGGMSYVIGLDVGGTTIKGGVLDGTSRVLADIRVKTYSDHNSREEILENMLSAIEQLTRQATRLGIGELAGIGMGVPGFVKSSEGVVYSAANLGLRDVNVKQYFEERVGVPCVVQGDARTGALAEYEFGAGQGASSLLYVVIGTGIGSGIIQNGRIYEGAHGLAAEIGHTIVDPCGGVCACGKRGCAETIVSGPVIIRAYQNRVGSEVDVSAKTIADFAREGEADALAVYREVARTLALALANYCTLVDPSTIVIGGGVSLAGDVLFGPLREFFSVYSSPVARGLIEIVPAMLGDRSGVVGASLLVKEFLQA